MRRATSLLTKTFPNTLVVDGEYPNPRPVSEALLGVVTFGDTAQAFESLVHQPCKPDDAPRFRLSASALRPYALMPVASATSTVWVPFMVCNGSAGTFLCKRTVDALDLSRGGRAVDIMGKRVLWSKSSHNFEGINVLGTDFLRYGNLTIRYAAHSVEFELLPDAVEVTDGASSFRVSPERPFVASLKEAIFRAMAARPSALAPSDITVADPAGTVLGDGVPLQAAARYAYTLRRGD